MKYEVGKDMTTAKERLTKGKTKFSSSNLLGKLSNDKLSKAIENKKEDSKYRMWKKEKRSVSNLTKASHNLKERQENGN